MKFINTLLSLSATVIISCGVHIDTKGGDTDSLGVDSPKVDTAKIDTIKADTMEVDSRTEVIDTLKKKDASNLYTSKCVAYRSLRTS